MNDRPTLGTPNVGDTVIIIQAPISNRYRPEPIEATITKVARLFVTITENANNRRLYEGQFFRAREWRMRMSTQHSDSQTSNYDRFVTPEQHAWDKRNAAAQKYLDEAGIQLDHRARVQNGSGFTITLANLLLAHHGLDPL